MDKKIVLIVNAHPLGNTPTSYSNQVRQHFVEQYKKLMDPSKEEIRELTLADEDIPSLGDGLLAAWEKLGAGKPITDKEKAIVKRQEEILAQFMAAKKYVISYPLFNLMVPSKMKDYIDNVLIAKKTFQYTAKGPQGLLTDGRALVMIQGSGSVYTNNDGYGALEHGQKYLQTIFAFVGVTACQTVRAEGTAFLPKETILKKAFAEADQAAKFLAAK